QIYGFKEGDIVVLDIHVRTTQTTQSTTQSTQSDSRIERRID
ncbi:unnamed protein product, partial [marine sediment metagenome]